MHKKIQTGMIAIAVISLLMAAALTAAVYFTDYFPIWYWLPLLVLGGLIVVLWCLRHSRVIAAKITAQIAAVDSDAPDSASPDELTEFVRSVLRQHGQIEQDMHVLGERTETITAILGNMRDGFVMFNRFGGIVTANTAAMAVFGLAGEYEETLEGKTAERLTHSPIFADKVTAALQGESGQMALDSFLVSFVPSADKGAVVLIADITERQLAERTRREFSANVAHELKTPLAAVSGFAALMRNSIGDSENIMHFAGKIAEETARMTALTDNILLLAKMDEMDGPESFKPFDAADLAESCVKAHAARAEQHKISLVLTASACKMAGNAPLMYELFGNLIENAIMYSNPGGTVKIAVSARNEVAYISVTDDGNGIPPGELPRVFERFYSRSGGTGLGLAIVKNIVRYHRGTINIDSDLGEGTRVYVKFPIGG